MKNLNKIPGNNPVEINENGVDTMSVEFKKIVSEVRGGLKGTLEDLDTKLISLLAFLLFTLGCSATENLVKNDKSVPSLKVSPAKKNKPIDRNESPSEKEQEIMTIIKKVQDLKADAKNIPDVEADSSEPADLAEGLAHFDMGIEITDAEKEKLREELGIDKPQVSK
jgi:hypothetical protein